MNFEIILFVFFCCFSYGSADCTSGVYEWGVSDDEKNQIVNLHNSMRLLIATGQLSNQPQGSNLLQMSWDDTLASSAQNIADSCVYGHQPVTDGRFGVGQNIYTWYSTGYFPGANWTGAVYSWFDEYQSYTYDNQDYNHYTQVVWASSYLVGCGYTYYPNQGWNQKFYVCNYGPAGNVIGEYPYQTGQGCTNLCSPGK